ncbi:transmembrane protein 128-like [Anneissia japonica]|uniref:transmembrane protein 128-like n=1 Tax=Anneissia japonica TaxID=1529436 RepID=UPI001425B6AB|nr:transmembrane protein 128-like [Anneissia japonica]
MIKMAENVESYDEIQLENVEKDEDEFDIRRRKIAEAFINAYGIDVEKFKNIDPERLIELQKQKEEEEARNRSPYNLQNLLWLVALFCIFYYTEFVLTLQTDPRIKRGWLYTGCVLVGVNCCIGFYLIVVCTWIKKIEDWESHFPSAIPLATASFVFGSICLNVALWPVYGILAPIILFTFLMGVIIFATLIPGSRVKETKGKKTKGGYQRIPSDDKDALKED